MQTFEEKLNRAARPYRAVAFDVFGTLLRREVAEPADVFRWMERTGRAPAGFAQKRIAAEAAARTPGREVTLAEIYARPELAGLTPEAECAAERQLAAPNAAVVRAARACRAGGKRVYAVSDIYLPKARLEAMLAGCGVDFLDDVFVSSEYGVQKRSGKLFRIFLRETGLSPRQVLFVGDDRRADFAGAALAGIRCLMAPASRLPAYLPPPQGLEQGALAAFLENHAPGGAEEGGPEALGFTLLGPALTAFAAWVGQRYVRRPECRLLFLARDMYLVRRICRLAGMGEEAGYLQVSRRSLCPALLQRPMTDAGLELLADALPRQRLTTGQLLDYCGFAPGTAWPGGGRDRPVDLRARPLDAETRQSLCTLAALSKGPAGAPVRRQGALARAYLRQQGLGTGETLLVDIGSGGTTQRILEELCGKPMHGCYFACDERLRQALPPERADVFLFDGAPAPLWYWAGQPLLERLISEPCGATVGYRVTEGTVAAVCEEAPPNPAVAAVQDGILNFAVLWRASPLAALTIPPEYAIAGFLEMVRAPRPAQAACFGDLWVEDGGVYPLAQPKGWGFYLARPRALKADFAVARWKVGFLRRLFRLPLPYGRLYAAAKRGR